MKRQITEAQRRKAQARKEAFRGLCSRLAKMSKDERARWQAEAGLVVTIEGRALSPRNTVLLYFQRQDVSMVGGFRQWIKAGRAVRKGEHGLSILVPAGGGTKQNDDGGEEEAQVYFIGGTVFDISQTEELVKAEAVVEMVTA